MKTDQATKEMTSRKKIQTVRWTSFTHFQKQIIDKTIE